MSTPEIDQVLAQMRVARAQATGVTAGIAEPEGIGFRELLSQSINAVNETQQTTNSLRHAFERGEDGIELAEVMIAAQKSSLSFEAMVQVRNKLVEAYKDVMNMPV